MYRKDNRYYVAYGFDGESPRDDIDYFFGGVKNDFADYETALKYAMIDHKEEINFQKEENGNASGELFNTYVMRTEAGYRDYEVAVISGWRSRVTEIEYED